MSLILWILAIHFGINIVILIAMGITGSLKSFPLSGWIRGLLIGWVEVLIALLFVRDMGFWGE